MQQGQQIDTNKLLQIIGAKETELTILREYIAQLEQEKQQGEARETKERKDSKPLQTDPVE